MSQGLLRFIRSAGYVVFFRRQKLHLPRFLRFTETLHRLGAAGLTRAFSVIGNLLILVLAVGIAWPMRYHLLHNWQALGILVVTVIELLFALRG